MFIIRSVAVVLALVLGIVGMLLGAAHSLIMDEAMPRLHDFIFDEHRGP